MHAPLTSMSAISSGTVAVPVRKSAATVPCERAARKSAITMTFWREVRSATAPPIMRMTIWATTGDASTNELVRVEPVRSNTPKVMAMGAMALPV